MTGKMTTAPSICHCRGGPWVKAAIKNAVLLTLLAGCGQSAVRDSGEPELQTRPDSVFHPETGALMFVLPPNWDPADLESVSGNHGDRREKLAERLQETRAAQDSIE